MDNTFEQPPNDVSVSDGFGDKAVRYEEPYYYNNAPFMVSQGVRLVSADTNGAATVTLDPISLSASGGSAVYSGYGWKDFYRNTVVIPTRVGVSVSTIDTLDATSTADASATSQLFRHPQWFSGTACTVKAYANPAYFAADLLDTGVTTPTEHLTSATVRINGQIVRSYPEDYSGHTMVQAAVTGE